MEVLLAARGSRRTRAAPDDRRRPASPLDAFLPLAAGVLLVFATVLIVGRPA
jgi:hypothetical protein